MKILGIINEHNLTKEQINKLPVHKKVRGVLFKNKDILVCVEETSHKIENLLGLPGGTVEKNETNLKAFKREVLEETGYNIKNIKVIGVIKVIRKKYVSFTTCYMAETAGKRMPLKLTKDEIKVNTKSIEINKKKAINRIKSEYNKSPNDNSLRSLIILDSI